MPPPLQRLAPNPNCNPNPPMESLTLTLTLTLALALFVPVAHAFHLPPSPSPSPSPSPARAPPPQKHLTSATPRLSLRNAPPPPRLSQPRSVVASPPPPRLSHPRPAVMSPPPPGGRGLGLGRILGIVFAAVAVALQMALGGFLAYKRWQLRRRMELGYRRSGHGAARLSSPSSSSSA